MRDFARLRCDLDDARFGRDAVLRLIDTQRQNIERAYRSIEHAEATIARYQWALDKHNERIGQLEGMLGESAANEA